MSLQWYPGHMTKARREMAALMPSQDVVIEVLDARIPKASSNPETPLCNVCSSSAQARVFSWLAVNNTLGATDCG